MKPASDFTKQGGLLESEHGMDHAVHLKISPILSRERKRKKYDCHNVDRQSFTRFMSNGVLLKGTDFMFNCHCLLLLLVYRQF
jgi:hypothetical protein